jgi:hypothetical protein
MGDWEMVGETKQSHGTFIILMVITGHVGEPTRSLCHSFLLTPFMYSPFSKHNLVAIFWQ